MPSEKLALLAAMGAADKIHELSPNGVGAGQSLWRGITYGAIEAVAGEVMREYKRYRDLQYKQTKSAAGVCYAFCLLISVGYTL